MGASQHYTTNRQLEAQGSWARELLRNSLRPFSVLQMKDIWNF